MGGGFGDNLLAMFQGYVVPIDDDFIIARVKFGPSDFGVVVEIDSPVDWFGEG